METSSRNPSRVTPVVVREELRPPLYGKRYSESASRTFYTKYLEYKRLVEHANTGGAVWHQIGSMAQQVPTHIQRAFARLAHNEREITPLQRAGAIKKHAGHAAGAEVELTQASAAVAKAVAMEARGKTILERVEPVLANLEKKYFADNPNVELVYRFPDGVFIPSPAVEITKTVLVQLQQLEINWKANPYRVLEIIVAEARERWKIDVVG